jgi:mannose-6-phosphate isomerase-like protein (cupin superfamily)
MQIRRVVTGQTKEGLATVVSDEKVEPITVGLMPGAEFHAVWGSDDQVNLPTDGTRPDTKGWFPTPTGFRFGLFTVPPATTTLPSDFDLATGIVELSEKLPGLGETLELGNPGMHTTDTVDYVTVLSGEVSLELDNAEQVHLRPGDCVVQNGTRHAWRNHGSGPCVMAVAIIGATRKG